MRDIYPELQSQALHPDLDKICTCGENSASCDRIVVTELLQTLKKFIHYPTFIDILK